MTVIAKKALWFVIVIVHFLITILATVGFLLPPQYLWIHLCVWPSIRVHWLFNDNNCILGQIELDLARQLNIQPSILTTRPGTMREKELRLTRTLISHLGFDEQKFHDRDLERLPITILTLSWMISFVLYMVYVVSTINKTKINRRDWMRILIMAYMCGILLDTTFIRS